MPLCRATAPTSMPLPTVRVRGCSLHGSCHGPVFDLLAIAAFRLQQAASTKSARLAMTYLQPVMDAAAHTTQLLSLEVCVHVHAHVQCPCPCPCPCPYPCPHVRVLCAPSCVVASHVTSLHAHDTCACPCTCTCTCACACTCCCDNNTTSNNNNNNIHAQKHAHAIHMHATTCLHAHVQGVNMYMCMLYMCM